MDLKLAVLKTQNNNIWIWTIMKIMYFIMFSATVHVTLDTVNLLG